jgi:tRNA dimethylallyltransferase
MLVLLRRVPRRRRHLCHRFRRFRWLSFGWWSNRIDEPKRKEGKQTEKYCLISMASRYQATFLTILLLRMLTRCSSFHAPRNFRAIAQGILSWRQHLRRPSTSNRFFNSLKDMSSSDTPSSRPLVVIIAGPTAVGKSDVAAKVCARNRGVIVSADSVQAYRGVQIGANKPTREEMEATPHLLIDVADADKSYNAAEWTRDALHCIKSLSKHPSGGLLTDDAPEEYTAERWQSLDEAIRQARSVKNVSENDPLLPVVVGGTMMYVQWLVQGRPDALRPTETALQKALQVITEHQQKGDWEGAVSKVSSMGTKFVQQIEKLSGRDWYRLRRILEVAYTVEEKGDESLIDGLYNGLRADKLDSFGFDVRCFFLCPTDRMVHSKVVDERCEQMIIKGLLEETVDLASSGQLPDMATKAIGYRQTLEFVQAPIGKDLDESAFTHFLLEFTSATRRYSKRQMQWFRRDKDFVFVPVTSDGQKETRVEDAAVEIGRLLTLSREDFDSERLDSNSINEQTRQANEAQGKTMKTYQFSRRHLLADSKLLQETLERADACRNRYQAKRSKHDDAATA